MSPSGEGDVEVERKGVATATASLGVWQMIPGSNVSRSLARTGVDWVLVDCEHGNIDGVYGPFLKKFVSLYTITQFLELPFCKP